MDRSEYSVSNELLRMAVKECLENERKEFLAMECVEPRAGFRRRVLRRMRQERNRVRYQKPRMVFRAGLVACLVLLSLLFAVCMSITAVREAIWKATVDWYETHFTVRYEAEENPPALTAIEKIHAPTYMPEGYRCESVMKKICYSQTYYNEKGEFAYYFDQSLLSAQASLDSQEASVEAVKIGAYDGYLSVDEDGWINLLWSDGQYGYCISGLLENEEELFRIAQSLS